MNLRGARLLSPQHIFTITRMHNANSRFARAVSNSLKPAKLRDNNTILMFFNNPYGVLMKKFFTLLAITSAIIPVIHGMEANLPADVQKKYDNLTVLIQSADIEAFKPAFDELTLPTENIAALRQVVAETKTAVAKELEAMGDKNKNWSKIAKGGLASVAGAIAGISGAAGLITFFNAATKNNQIIREYTQSFATLAIIPTAFLRECIELSNVIQMSLISATSILYLDTTYKTIPYGIKTLKAGLNYKEHLQTMLADLDAIDAHMAQVKA